jgi:hypothetical protein
VDLSFGRVFLGLSICLGWVPSFMFKMVMPLGFGWTGGGVVSP